MTFDLLQHHLPTCHLHWSGPSSTASSGPWRTSPPKLLSWKLDVKLFINMWETKRESRKWERRRRSWRCIPPAMGGHNHHHHPQSSDCEAPAAAAQYLTSAPHNGVLVVLSGVSLRKAASMNPHTRQRPAHATWRTPRTSTLFWLKMKYLCRAMNHGRRKRVRIGSCPVVAANRELA